MTEDEGFFSPPEPDDQRCSMADHLTPEEVSGLLGISNQEAKARLRGVSLAQAVAWDLLGEER